MTKNISLFSIQKLLTTIVFISIFTMAVRIPFSSDTWWHLTSGHYIIKNATIPFADPFSHTQAGQLWIDHSWMAQIFWYGLFAMGGWTLVSLAVALLVTLAFWFVWKQLDGINIFVAAFAMILGAIVSSVVWSARPQMITFVLTAITAYLLHRFKRDNGSLLPWLPLMMLVWVNVHGGFAIGFMLMLAYLLGEAANNLTRHTEDPVVNWSGLRYLSLVMLICLAVVVINPYAWRMWLYPFQTVGIDALRDFVQEWQSPDFHLIYVQPFALMLLLILASMARAGRQADWTDLVLIAMWAFWGLFAARNIAIFGLVAMPILARYADVAWTRQWQVWGYEYPPFSKPRRSNPLLNWILLGLVSVAALVKIVIPLTPQTNFRVEQAGMPFSAVEFVQSKRPAGPMFNSYNWGGYLMFKLWPDYPVYIDGRTDLYDDAFIRRYLGVMAADDGWQDILDADRINLIFIENDSVLDKFLRLATGWKELYRDDMAVIYKRVE